MKYLIAILAVLLLLSGRRTLARKPPPLKKTYEKLAAMGVPGFHVIEKGRFYTGANTYLVIYKNGKAKKKEFVGIRGK